MGIARGIAERFGFVAKAIRIAVPKLAVASNRGPGSPTAWFICPEFAAPSGGIRNTVAARFRCGPERAWSLSGGQKQRLAKVVA